MTKKNEITKEDEQAFLDEIMRQSDAMALGVTPTELKKDETEKEGQLSKKMQQYEAQFLKPVNIVGRKGKMIYLREEYHKRISTILLVTPKEVNMSIFAYVDNVLTEHFEKYWTDIVAYIQDNQKKVFNDQKK